MGINTSIQKITSALRGVPAFPLVILLLFVSLGIFGSLLMPHDPNKMMLDHALLPPLWQHGGSINYPLGTDHLGRDILSRIIGGANISLEVGFIVVFFAGALGTVLALICGFFGSWVDSLIMRFTDTFLSLPYMLIAIVLAVVLGSGKNNIILILVIMGWAQYTRVLRSEVLRVKDADYVRLAKIAGSSNVRIMLRHIFPGTVNTLIIMGTLQLGNVIITESSLSFLGVGVPPPDPAWGSMLADGTKFITSAWWLCVWPGLTILLVVLSCNLLGDWLRFRMDPKFRQL